MYDGILLSMYGIICTTENANLSLLSNILYNYKFIFTDLYIQV